MPYERLQIERLGEHIRSHLIGGYQDQFHLASMLQLPHLENLAFDMTRVLMFFGITRNVGVREWRRVRAGLGRDAASAPK